MSFFAEIYPNVKHVLIAIYGILIFATAVVFLLKKMKPHKNFRELQQRVNSWWAIITVFALVIHGSDLVTCVFFALLSGVALHEFLSIAPSRGTDRRVVLWSFLAVPVQYYFIYVHWYNMFIIFIPIYLFLLIPLRMILIGNTQEFLKTASIYHWALMTTVFCLGHLAFFSAFPNSSNPAGGSAGFLLFLVFLTQFNDVAQYCWGKSFGKHKIIPKISPNKTWEGFLGGMATTFLATYLLAPILTPIHGWKFIFPAFIFSAGGFVGDVVMSAVKRDIGIKDTGALIPGHGGILDRLDSLTYTAPLFFHFVKYFYY